MAIKTISLYCTTTLLCLILSFPVFGTAKSSVMIQSRYGADDAIQHKTSLSIEKNLAPLPAGKDELLFKNPDRGFRQETKADIVSLAAKPKVKQRTFIYKAIQKLLDEARPETVTLVQTYVYLGAYRDGYIPTEALSALETYLDVMGEFGLKALLRFAYSRKFHDLENEATEETMLRHMKQLSPLMHKKKDNIHAYQAGFIGAWGEWHSQKHPVNTTAIMNGILDVLTPSDMYIQIRLPRYKKESVPQSHPRYKKIGFNDDALFGKDLNTHRGGSGRWDPGTEQWEMAMKEAPYAPQDAELFWSPFNFEKNIYCDGFMAILQMSELRNTSLSVLHGYRDAAFSIRHGYPDAPYRKTTMERWKEQSLTEAWLTENKITYAPGWFKDTEGKSINRNVFEFIRDYLGYRIEAQSIRAKETNLGLSVEMSLVNHGFSAAFNLESGFALLDESNQVVTTIKAGEPSGWHSRSPEDYLDNTLPIYKLKGVLNLPKKSGKYKLAFYLRNQLGHSARIANRIEFINGFNVLCDFEL